MTVVVLVDETKQVKSHKGFKRIIEEVQIKGPGYMHELSVDNRVVLKSVRWNQRCLIKPGVGLICDGKLLVFIESESCWCVKTLRVDRRLIVRGGSWIHS